MSILNKFVSSFNNLGDEYDDEYLDDYYDEEIDEYEDKKSNKVNFFKGAKPKKSSYDEYDDAPAPRKNSGMGVCVIKPTSVDDGREICETLLGNRTVILNVEGIDLEVAQRIIDFTSGAAYSMNGRLQKITNAIFLVTPSNVDISGDLQDILGGSFDVSSMRNRY